VARRRKEVGRLGAMSLKLLMEDGNTCRGGCRDPIA
jgi:hypothetical protein